MAPKVARDDLYLDRWNLDATFRLKTYQGPIKEAVTKWVERGCKWDEIFVAKNEKIGRID